ncbi:MAG: DNA replication/repair protein RecF [Clostridia bacterium]|nr:DNA replication/repair protein RecF [Clostridia bacterium]
MYCKRIKAKNFRNIEQADVAFDDGVNILVGENAQGKTNLLESLFYVSVGKSFRAGHSAEIIRFGESFSELELDYNDGIRDQSIKMQIFRDRQRRVEKNRVRIDKMSDIVGSFRAVLFCPEHLSLIKEGPAMRRNYMDIAISRLYPLYMKTLQRYNYILKQRNALIKNSYNDRSSFDATAELWSLQLAHEAAAISKYRAEFIKRVNGYVARCFSDMTGEREKTSISYSGSAHLEEDGYFDAAETEKKYISLLTSSYEREISAGATLWGIHKDDIDIKLNEKPARLYCSQGQQRSLALSLKIAEGEICRDEFGDYPVLLLDDVLSELDASRRGYLISEMDSKQVIMTCCESVFNKDASIIKVENGRYIR